MIRYSFINNEVLKIYSLLPHISFPLYVEKICDLIPNCKYMSYQKFARINNCSLDEVIALCESKSGCTHYDVVNDRYLIMSNHSVCSLTNYGVSGRQMWTIAHEIGHVVCGHHTALSTYDKLAENSLCKPVNPEFETEADYFAATLLSPFPFFEKLGIGCAMDIQNVFGLSTTASIYRYKQYIKWRNSRVKTSWENDMIKLADEKLEIYY